MVLAASRGLGLSDRCHPGLSGEQIENKCQRIDGHLRPSGIEWAFLGRHGPMTLAERRGYHRDDTGGTIAAMAPSSIKSAHQQLDLLGATGATTAASPTALSKPTRRRATPSAIAGRPSMVPTASLFECAANPRTEFPEAELVELAEDIRQHGILQPIVVHPAEAEGRHQIHFGAKRWRAALRLGLQQVPVVVRDAPSNPYAQVAENQKRHGLTPLDLARFIRSRVDAGESNTAVAHQLGMDLTAVAHHLALLALPPVVDAALTSGRCASPRTLYELSRLHADQPDAVIELLDSAEPVTRETVAKIRSKLVVTPAAERAPHRAGQRATRNDRLLACASNLCEKLDAALIRLTQANGPDLQEERLAALRKRIQQAAARITAP